MPPLATPEGRFAGLWHDVKHALRILTRQPGFAALVVATMALGIGATTTLFSVTYGVLLKPLPWPGADRLIVLKESRGGRQPRFGSFTNTAYIAWRDGARTVDELAAWAPRTFTLTGDGGPERVRAANVTASLFRAIGATPSAGAFFTDADELAPVVVIAESLWRGRFGADPGLIGRSISVDGQPHIVVAVMTDAVAWPNRDTKAWLPLRVPPSQGNQLTMLEAIARLAPGATLQQAIDEATARGRHAAPTGMTTTAIFGGDGAVGVTAQSLPDSLTADVRLPLQVLLGAVGLLLVIAVTNVAGLQLARSASRHRELVIRASIGATTSRLARQLIIESLVLGLLGGSLGLGLAWLLTQSAASVLPADFPRAGEATITLPIVWFAATLSLATSVAFGVTPAFGLRRLTLTHALGVDGARQPGVQLLAATRWRAVMVTAQIAIATTLLVGAVLLSRSFLAMLGADRGLDAAAVVGARVALPAPVYSTSSRPALLEQIIEDLRRASGVNAAAFSTELPLTPGGSTSAFTMPGRTPGAETVTVQASPRIVSPGYFATLGLAILEGRPLAESDTATSEPVLVVNDTFRRRYLGANALGARLPMALWGQNQTGDATIVGISEDVRYVGAAAPTLPEIYFSYRQLKGGIRPSIAWLLVRPRDPDAQTGRHIREAVSRADPTLVPESIMTLEDRLLAGSLARPRLYATLITGFSAIALVVTGVGLFAVLSYSVSRRMRELAVRAALGASRFELARQVLARTTVIASIGIAIGLTSSLLLARFISSLLYGVGPADLTTYLAVAVILAAVTLTASLIPAGRAATVDAIRVLRSEQ